MANIFVTIYEGVKSKAVITGLLLLVLGGIGKDVYNNLSLPADKEKFELVNKTITEVKEKQTDYILNQELMKKDVSNLNSNFSDFKASSEASFSKLTSRIDQLINLSNRQTYSKK